MTRAVFDDHELARRNAAQTCIGRNGANRTMVGMTRPGAYAEFMTIPAASLVAMPQDMPAVAAALTKPAATAWHAVNLSMRALARLAAHFAGKPLITPA